MFASKYLCIIDGENWLIRFVCDHDTVWYTLMHYVHLCIVPPACSCTDYAFDGNMARIVAQIFCGFNSSGCISIAAFTCSSGKMEERW